MVRHICPKLEGVVSFVMREVWWVVIPPGGRGLIGTESLVVIPRGALPVEGWWVKDREAGERLQWIGVDGVRRWEMD